MYNYVDFMLERKAINCVCSDAPIRGKECLEGRMSRILIARYMSCASAMASAIVIFQFDFDGSFVTLNELNFCRLFTTCLMFVVNFRHIRFCACMQLCVKYI